MTVATIYSGSNAARLIEVMRAQPEGARLTTRQLCLASSVPLDNAAQLLRKAVAGGYLVRHGTLGGKPSVGYSYSLGQPCEFTDRREVVRRLSDVEEQAVITADEIPEPILVTKLRDLYFTGAATATGEPLRLLADALQAARQVLDARGRTRFKGAEVEQFVGREIRAISTAILNATKNLNDALETTL